MTLVISTNGNQVLIWRFYKILKVDQPHKSKFDMNKLEHKKSILLAGIAKHKSVISDFEKQIAELQESRQLINEDDQDMQQQSLNEELSGRINQISEQMRFASDELHVLNQILDTLEMQDRVAPGALVETDKRTFLISASIESFDLNGKEYFGISVHTPIYNLLKGLQKGESIKYNDISYRILDIS